MNKPFTIKLKTLLEWRPIKDDPEYMVSNYNQIKSFKVDKINGRILKQSLNEKGYPQVCLQINGKSTTRKVHQLIAECFLEYPKGVKPGVYTVDHIDRNKRNNCLSNLRYATWSQQCMNQNKKMGCSSIYKGVSKRGNGFQSVINFNGKYAHIGYYNTELKAGQAYNDYVTANNLPNELNDLSK